MQDTAIPQVMTAAGARRVDRAAADQARAAAREAEQMSQLRIEQARREAGEQARGRAEARKHEQRGQARVERAARRAHMAEVWRERQPLAVVLPLMAASAGVALPAQFEAYNAATGNPASALAMAGMIEGGTWLGAALESAATRHDQPAGFYRAMTWGGASLAAGVNVLHVTTSGGGADMAVTLGTASMMGAGAWSAYMHYRHGKHSSRSADDIRLTLLRRLRYPLLTWRSLSLRAAAGTALTPEQAWTQVWEDAHGPRTPITRDTDTGDTDTGGGTGEAKDTAPHGVDLDPEQDDQELDLEDGPTLDEAETRTEQAVIVNALRERYPHWSAETVNEFADALAPAGFLPTPAPRTPAPSGADEATGPIAPVEVAEPAEVAAADSPARTAGVGPVAGRMTSTRGKVIALRAKHPDWSAAKIAERVQVTERTVRRYLNTPATSDDTATEASDRSETSAA